MGQAESYTIGPNEQAVFQLEYDVRAVLVSNVVSYDGCFAYVWVYRSATAVTPKEALLQSQANVRLEPPPCDGFGSGPATLIIFNTGGAIMKCVAT